MKTQYAYPTMLSVHFSFAELTHSDTATVHGIDNSPPLEFVPRLVELAAMLERIRAALGCPLTISSGYRCERLNSLVGGQKNSDHLYARAADFQAPGRAEPYTLAKILAPQVQELGIGQLIYEGVRGRRWVHVSTNGQRPDTDRVITISDSGTVPGIQEVA